MENKDYIKELFSDKLSNLEAPVRPELWSGIASQIGAVAPAASVGISLISKVVIGVSVAASITIATYSLLKETPSSNKTTETKQQVSVESSKEEHTPDLHETANVSQKNVKKNQETIIEIVTPEVALEKAVEVSVKDEAIILPIQQKKIEEKEAIIEPVFQEKGEEKNAIEQKIVENPEVVEDYNTVESKQLFLPNIITPNGDGVHDNLSLDLKGYSDISVVVLNMKNEIVFQTTDPEFIWDVDFLSGDYIYYLTCRDSNGKLISKYNSLRIQR